VAQYCLISHFFVRLSPIYFSLPIEKTFWKFRLRRVAFYARGSGNQCTQALVPMPFTIGILVLYIIVWSFWHGYTRVSATPRVIAAHSNIHTLYNVASRAVWALKSGCYADVVPLREREGIVSSLRGRPKQGSLLGQQHSLFLARMNGRMGIEKMLSKQSIVRREVMFSSYT
jgi:hypothetical protein